MANGLDKPRIEVGDLELKARELLLGLRGLRERRHVTSPQEMAPVKTNLSMSDLILDRPSRMSSFQDAHIEFLIEEAEQFASLVKTMTVDAQDAFQSPQRRLFEKITDDLRRDLKRFTADALLAIKDVQEIRRRIEAS
jgi:hypothetical protein